MSVELTAVDGTLRPSTPVELFTLPRAGPRNWYFSMDGRAERFLMILPPAQPVEDTPPPITVVVNYVQSLAKK